MIYRDPAGRLVRIRRQGGTASTIETYRLRLQDARLLAAVLAIATAAMAAAGIAAVAAAGGSAAGTGGHWTVPLLAGVAGLAGLAALTGPGRAEATISDVTRVSLLSWLGYFFVGITVATGGALVGALITPFL